MLFDSKMHVKKENRCKPKLTTVFEKKEVPQAGLEPARALHLTGFSYQLRLLPLVCPLQTICGLDFLFILPLLRSLDAAY